MESGANAGAAAVSAVGGAASAAYSGIGNFAQGVYDKVTGNDPPTGGTISAQGKSTKVSKNAAPRFQKVLDYMTKKGYKIKSLGGFVDRDVRGRPGTKSAHGRGWAIDINPAENPLQEGRGPVKTDMSPDIIQFARAQGLGWGGAWKSRRDAMHFSAQKNEGGTFKARDGGLFDGPGKAHPAAMKMMASLDTQSIVMKLAKTPASNAVNEKKKGAMDKNAAAMYSQNSQLTSELARKLDQVIDALENDNSVQTKILKHSRA
jgi:hypothetical protein